MSEGYNRVMMLGGLAADPELRFTRGGQAILHLRLAVTERRKIKDEWKESTGYFNVTVWGKRGEALGKILTKGSSVFVEGSLRISTYDGRDGNKRTGVEIVANNVILTGNRGQRANPDDTSEPEEPRRPPPMPQPRRRTPAPQEAPADDYENGGGFGEEDPAPF